MRNAICAAGLVLAAIVAGTAIEARTEGLSKLQYRHPATGVLLPPEPLEAVPGCLCSVHHKNVLPSKEPALPFRQGQLPPDAPPLDSIPPVPAPGDVVQTMSKGSRP